MAITQINLKRGQVFNPSYASVISSGYIPAIASCEPWVLKQSSTDHLSQLWVDGTCINPELRANSNITISQYAYDATNNVLYREISATDTTYIADEQWIHLDTTNNTFEHKNADSTSLGTPTTTTSATPFAWGSAITIPTFTYDVKGHIVSAEFVTTNLPAAPTIPNNYSVIKVGTTAIGPSTSTSTLTFTEGTTISLTSSNDSITINHGTVSHLLNNINTNNLANATSAPNDGLTTNGHLITGFEVDDNGHIVSLTTKKYEPVDTSSITSDTTDVYVCQGQTSEYSSGSGPVYASTDVSNNNAIEFTSSTGCKAILHHAEQINSIGSIVKFYNTNNSADDIVMDIVLIDGGTFE